MPSAITTKGAIDGVRSWLLMAAVASLTIPGFAGWDLAIAGVRLGRFQPFKFIFIAWLCVQIAWLWANRARVGWRHWRSVPWLTGSLLLLDVLLAVGLLAKGGGPRGWSIWLSLLLGQVGAFVSVFDPEFSIKGLRRGIVLAVFILLGFALMELIWPTSAFTIRFLSLVRDDPHVSYQLGSSLSTVALAEWIVRALPLFVVVMRKRAIDLIVLGLMILMQVMTLERSGLLALVAVAAVAWYLGFGRKLILAGVMAAMTVVVGVIVVKGPDQLIGRYFGMFSSSPTNRYASLSRQAAEERKTFLILALNTIKANPLTGVGLEGFAHRRENQVPILVNSKAAHCHNLFVEMGVAGGFLAMLAFGISFFGYAWAAFKAPVHLAACLYCVGQLVSALLDARIYVSWFAITLFWFAGMAWVIGRPDDYRGASQG